MNTSAVKALIFTAGALVGSAVTYILCKKSEKDRVDQLIFDYENEIRQINEAISAKDIPEEAVEASEDPTKARVETLNTDYTAFYKTSLGPSIDNPAYEKMVEDQSYAGGEESGPQTITSFAYAQNEEEYEQIDLQYYIEDDYLCYADDVGEAIDNKDELVGDRNLAIFNITDADTIWVRNPRYRQMYEIEKLYGPCPINDDF